MFSRTRMHPAANTRVLSGLRNALSVNCLRFFVSRKVSRRLAKEPLPHRRKASFASREGHFGVAVEPFPHRHTAFSALFPCPYEGREETLTTPDEPCLMRREPFHGLPLFSFAIFRCQNFLPPFDAYLCVYTVSLPCHPVLSFRPAEGRRRGGMLCCDVKES